MIDEKSFCEWVEEWLTDPTRWHETPPDLDRVMCFCALVRLLCDCYPKDTPIIHCQFTYLLLGVNTWLGGKHEFQYPEDREPLSHEVDVVTPSIRRLIVKLLTPGSEITTGDKHNFLVHLRHVCSAYSGKTKTDHHGEMLGLLPLMSLTFRGWNKPLERMKIPDDPLTMRACIDLAIRFDKAKAQDAKLIYVSNTSLDLEGWLVETIDRLYRTCPSIDEIMNQMAYVTWFIGLLKAKSIIREKARVTDWYDEFASAVSTEKECILRKLREVMDAGQEPEGTTHVLGPIAISKLLKASGWKPKLFQ